VFDLVVPADFGLVKSAIVLPKEKLYQAIYCPMAKNNEGAFWLSCV